MLPGFLYTTSREGLWLHHYAPSTVRAATAEARELRLAQSTDYPWDGEITLEIEEAPRGTFSLFVAIPGWCEQASLQVNDEPPIPGLEGRGYAELRRHWRTDDVVRLNLAMPVRLMTTDPRVEGNHGRVAVTRGPVVYCVEQADHDVPLPTLRLPADAAWDASFDADLLGGVTVLRAPAVAERDADGGDRLYRPRTSQSLSRRPTLLSAIPYFAWANREPGPMQVWVPLDCHDDGIGPELR